RSFGARCRRLPRGRGHAAGKGRYQRQCGLRLLSRSSVRAVRESERSHAPACSAAAMTGSFWILAESASAPRPPSLPHACNGARDEAAIGPRLARTDGLVHPAVVRLGLGRLGDLFRNIRFHGAHIEVKQAFVLVALVLVLFPEFYDLLEDFY